MAKRLHFHFSLSCIGEGHGNPLQCSCLENPRGGGAWWAAVYWVAQSRTRLKRLSSSSTAIGPSGFYPSQFMTKYWIALRYKETEHNLDPMLSFYICPLGAGERCQMVGKCVKLSSHTKKGRHLLEGYWGASRDGNKNWLRKGRHRVTLGTSGVWEPAFHPP